MDRMMAPRKRTWTILKKALLRRYGAKLDMSAAERRVNMRRMMPGETYATGLRDVVERNKLGTEPGTLEEAVDRATEVDDPMDNVAQGVQNTGQPWATAPSPYLIPMPGSTGRTMVFPGIGGTGLPTGMMTVSAGNTTAVDQEQGAMALFTNPQGVWYNCPGTWDVPTGRVWNGQFWAETKKGNQPRPQLVRREETKKPERKSKAKRDVAMSSEDEAEPPPQAPEVQDSAVAGVDLAGVTGFALLGGLGARAVQRAKAVEAWEQLRKRQVDHRKGRAASDGEPARVRLVQSKRASGVGHTDEDTENGMQYAEADDGLPTANVTVEGVPRSVKLESSARYTVAGTAWIQYGDPASYETPADYIKGVGGFLLDVVGV
ncbi:hypothetical protein PI126_g17387 [Phytophthora idaei]|nr:hypothetical protein PI126_g17387 [Phytophthora idaei]